MYITTQPKYFFSILLYSIFICIIQQYTFTVDYQAIAPFLPDHSFSNFATVVLVQTHTFYSSLPVVFITDQALVRLTAFFAPLYLAREAFT